MAKVVSLDLDFVAGMGGGASPAGIIIMLQGPDAGKYAYITSVTTGFGVDISVAIQETNIFYSGDINNLQLNMLNGISFSVDVAFSCVVDIGGAYSIAGPNMYGAMFYGFSLNVGIGAPTGGSFSINFNYTNIWGDN